ncbi:GntR family transcriptional regulator [Paenibacillus sp. PAMC21692]|uniref:GntR family transcriptional regulator n=1 Tax=Paenibacillus sp. PAMC21692 TaxID=2762320 RepID=UPI00164D7B9A|nr:GntR family transcriptional regulator [Paenibacillus sp. PAMC21692]QNK56126.1 GntR family transcriptional regulator [Paenibacillus sp. PAMC21692]
MSRNGKSMPMYAQIREYLLDGIEGGTWSGEEKLPSENELAEKFGVSRITIKKALDGLVEEGIVYRIQGKGSFVSENGKPRLYASERLQHRKSFVWLLMPRVNNLFTSSILRGVERTLDEAGCKLMFSSTDDSPEKEKELLAEASELGVSGVIVYPAVGEAYNEDILRMALSPFPVVIIDRYLRGVETNCVCTDNVQSSYEAVKYLLELGHRSIAFVSSPVEGTTSLEDRLTGYEKALSEHLIPVDRSLIVEPFDEKKMERLLKEQPRITAVFACNNDIGLRVIKAAERAGRNIPEGLSILFFDDFENSEWFRIPPSCVVQQPEAIGREAASMVLRLIDNPGAPRLRVSLPAKLVIRESTSAPPGTTKTTV